MKIPVIFFLFLLSNKVLAYNIGFWNLQNLYDVIKSKDHDDWAYLPINYKGKIAHCKSLNSFVGRYLCLNTHWTNEKLEFRVKVLKKALEKWQHFDLWCFCEVENIALIKRLVPGFRHFYGTYSNKRGQNIICASKRAFKSVRELKTIGYNRKVLVLGDKVKIAIVHLPSQLHLSKRRLSLIKFLKNRVDIFLGDTNLKEKEKKLVPFKEAKIINKEVKGTYYYMKKNKFHYFDTAFSNKRNIHLEILNEGKLKPEKYLMKKNSGLSDHFPIRIYLQNFSQE